MPDGDQPEIEVRCDCGFVVRGDEDTVVATTRDHGQKVHNMDVTREQVLAMASPTP